jgi:hypothetical protein
MLDKYNRSSHFSNRDVIIGTDSDLDVFLMRTKNNDGLYEIICSIDRASDPIYHPKDDERLALTAKAQNNFKYEGKKLWHERLAHANEKAVAALGKNEKNGINLNIAPDEVACAKCTQAKLPASSKTYPLVPSGTKIGDLIFSDVCGEMPVTGYNLEKYFVTFIDAASKHLFIELLPDKTAESVLASFKKVHKILKNAFSNPVKRLHTDNGGEYDNDLMKEYLAEEGIELTTTAPYNPRSNGVAERANRTVMNTVRAILLRSSLGFEYWPDVVRQVTYLHNRTPATNSRGVTPYQKVFGRIPSLGNILIFGCPVYAKVPDEKRKKLFEKSVKCALLQCLPGIQYKVLDLDNGDIYCLRDAKFDEAKFPFFGSRQGKFIRIGDEILGGEGSGPETSSEYNPDDENPSGNDSDYYGPDDDVNKETLITNGTQALPETPPKPPPPAGTPIDEDDYDDDAPLLPPPADENDNSGGEATEQASSRPQRIRKPVDRYIPVHLANARAATYDTPTFHDALIRDDADLWKETITKEINTLKERGTWELVDRPQNARVLPTKVVLKIKRCPHSTIDRYKARLVALGCLQRQSGYDETFSPVVDFSTVRSALTLSVYDKEHVHHVDVTGAFLYRHLSKSLYMTLPKGFDDGSRKICKLKKSIYGLKQAPRIWHQHLREPLSELNFKSVAYTECVFKRATKNTRIRMLAYVDDVLLISKSTALIQEVKSELQAKFKITDLGPATFFLGVEIQTTRNCFFLRQAAYI